MTPREAAGRAARKILEDAGPILVLNRLDRGAIAECVAAGIDAYMTERERQRSAEASQPETFEAAWKRMVARGFNYGADALENVRLGWDLAHGQVDREVDREQEAIDLAEAMHNVAAPARTMIIALVDVTTPEPGGTRLLNIQMSVEHLGITGGQVTIVTEATSVVDGTPLTPVVWHRLTPLQLKGLAQYLDETEATFLVWPPAADVVRHVSEEPDR